jgi:hypothetical protein
MKKMKRLNQQGFDKTRTANPLCKNNRFLHIHRKCVFYLSLLAIMSFSTLTSLMAQCALCTKTAQQLGDGPAAGLNKGILYLMGIPLGILSIIGYKWYKKEKINRGQEDNG